VLGVSDPDFKDPRVESEAMAAGLTCPFEIAMIAGAGHWPQAQAADATAAAILSLLQRRLGGSASEGALLDTRAGAESQG
jgi:pimeloyl-ACP methyl ester carboxylesterase